MADSPTETAPASLSIADLRKNKEETDAEFTRSDSGRSSSDSLREETPVRESDTVPAMTSPAVSGKMESPAPPPPVVVVEEEGEGRLGDVGEDSDDRDFEEVDPTGRYGRVCTCMALRCSRLGAM